MPPALSRILARYEPRLVLEEDHLLELKRLMKAAFPGEVPELPDTLPVTCVTADSRQCKPGCVFVAIPGTAVDGTRYAAQAVERGAIAVVAERRLELPDGVVQIVVPDARAAIADLAAAYYAHPAREMTAVGITGTNGKTSTSLLLREIFIASGRPTAVFGTILYEIGGAPEMVVRTAFARIAHKLPVKVRMVPRRAM